MGVMCVEHGAWWRRGSRVRWLAALLVWGALLLLALPRLQPPPGRQAPARLLLQSEPAAWTPDPPAFLTLPATDGHSESEAELREEVERRLPSLSLTYWYEHKDKKNKFYKKKDCARLPSIFDLEFQNTYWQTLRTPANGTFHLYAAYLDARPTLTIGAVVRILAVHDRIEPQLVTHCQLWYEERAAPVIVRTHEYIYLWKRKWGNYRNGALAAYLITCVLPTDVGPLQPVSVSLVVDPCDNAKNNLRVHLDLPPASDGYIAERKEFAVCVKGLDYLHEDISVRLVEWIELIRLLGADKIFFYELHVHPNITKVLKYYEEQGVVAVTPISLPGGLPNLPALQHMYLTQKSKLTQKRQMELIPYNDCLYRHMYQYRWLVLLDIDEVIVPLEDSDWSSLMKRVLPLSIQDAGKPSRTSYFASNMYYLDSLQKYHNWEEGVPRYMHMLQHVYRMQKFTKFTWFVKAFHDTDRVLALHNHLSLVCLGGSCSSFAIPPKIARLQHYRAKCGPLVNVTCEELSEQPVRDTVLWRWKAPLVRSVQYVLQTLGFLPSPAKTLLPPHR